MIENIFIHSSATPNGREHGAADMHRYHLERGWDGVGYHYVIKTNGKREAGRPEYWKGSHVGGYNSSSIGICLIGTNEFTLDQESALLTLLDELKQRYPDAKVRGHNEVSTKLCPGFNVQKWLTGEMKANPFNSWYE